MERQSITMEQPQSQWNSFNLSGTVTIALEQSRCNSNNYGTVTVWTSTTALEQSCVTVPAHILSMFQRYVTDPGFSPLWWKSVVVRLARQAAMNGWTPARPTISHWWLPACRYQGIVYLLACLLWARSAEHIFQLCCVERFDVSVIEPYFPL